MQKLSSFIREAASGTHLLPLSHEGIRPGSLLDARWAWSVRNRIRSFFNLERKLHGLRSHMGYGWELLSLNENDFPTAFENGSLLTGTLSDRFDFSGPVDLKPFGIDLSMDFDDHVASQLVVSDVSVHLFDRGFTGYELRRKLRELKDQDDPRYADIDESYLVVECFHLRDLKWTFSSDSMRKMQAMLAQKKIDLSVHAGVQWGRGSSSELTVSGTAEAPIAVRGLKV